MDMRKARALPFRGEPVGAGKSSLSGTDEVLPDVMVYNYMPIVYISIMAGVETRSRLCYNKSIQN